MVPIAIRTKCETIRAMAHRTKESEEKCEALLREIHADGLNAQQLDAPIARILESLSDHASIKEARYLERARAYAYLVDKRRLFEGKPESITEHRHVRGLTDQQLEERLKEETAKLQAHSESKSDSDKILH